MFHSKTGQKLTRKRTKNALPDWSLTDHIRTRRNLHDWGPARTGGSQENQKYLAALRENIGLIVQSPRNKAHSPAVPWRFPKWL